MILDKAVGKYSPTVRRISWAHNACMKHKYWEYWWELCNEWEGGWL